MFGGLAYSDANLGLWEKYVAKSDLSMPENMRNTTGYLTWTTIQLENLLVSEKAAKREGIDVNSITGFDSLLNPKLKGKIAWHGNVPTGDLMAQAKAELGGQR